MGRHLARAVALLTFTLTLVLLATLVPARALAGPSDGIVQAPSLDRSTPKRAMDGFLQAGNRGLFDVAMQYMDLRAVAKARQSKDGPDLAEKLWYVLTHTPGFETSKIPDDPTLVPPKNEPTLSVGTLSLGADPIPLTMSREHFTDGVDRWVIARGTVAMAPELYAAMGNFSWQDQIPDSLRATFDGNALWQWLGLLLALPIGYLVARLGTWLLASGLLFVVRRTARKADDYLVENGRRPLRLLFTALIFYWTTGALRLTEAIDLVVDHVVFTLFIVGCAWLALVLVATIVRWIDEGMPDESDSDLSLRSTRTRLLMFERVAGVLLVVVSTALVFMQFAIVRNVGVSLLASAGLAGVVLGFAAQKSLGTIFAGVQLSLTQPIRIGDSVVIEGEFGKIEQILLTYVVVNLWDDRRMVVPVSRFLEQPFQNWSKVTAQLTGAVTITCDFATPVDRAREELQRVTSASKLWDGRLCVLQVTEASDRSITLRALVSAANPSAAWDLRCEVREKLIAFLCALDGGRHLPRVREEPLPGLALARTISN
jgi:small-conductance mechanosensitive channel